MQSVAEIKRVRDGLVKELWDTVATDGNTEHTELLARIDTLNWVLTSEEEPRTIEAPAMTTASLFSLVNSPDPDEDPDDPNPDDEKPIAARSTLADTDGPDQSPSPTAWESLGGVLRRGTDKVIHGLGMQTPTEIIRLQESAEHLEPRMVPPYAISRSQVTEP